MALLAEKSSITDWLTADRLLGEGAYAEVYRVRHAFLGWQALKLFKRVATLEETNAMLEEARLLSKLGHPNIVRLFDANTLRTPEGSRGYITMEYVAGGSLERLLRAHERAVPTDVAVEVIEQITAALGLAHARKPPILHRDLTLDNVLVGYDDTGMRVRLSDFGLSKHADPRTQLASAQGTYAFMAPEVQRLEGYSRAADVWSLGTIAYLLLTGSFPYDDGNPVRGYVAHRYAEAPLPPSRFNEDVDPALDEIVLGALETDPAERTSSALELGERLRRRRAVPRKAIPPTGPGTAGNTPPGRRARELAARALELARDPLTLADAADLMEEAVNLSPQVRARHLYRLILWRRGVTM